MKRRFLFLAAALSTVLALGLTACNGDTANGEEHTHTYGEEWTYNPEYHWHTPDCGHNLEISDKAEHTFIDDVCVVCGYQKANGLDFILNADENSYTVTGNDNTVKEITIPAEYYGLPVTEIGNSAFRNYENLEKVNIPNSIEKICDLAFYGCEALTEVVLPQSLTTLCRCAFANCTALKSVNLPDSLTTLEYSVFDGTAYFGNLENWTDGVLYIGRHLVRAMNVISGHYAVRENTLTVAALSFDGCGKITEIELPNTVKYIGTLAFKDCYSLNKIALSDSLGCLGALAFHGCENLQELTLPASLTKIGMFALFHFTQLNYLGTADEWETVDKDEYSVSENCEIVYIDRVA
ncbi:MAG: leucine-rich repeat domain-containing protein [Clostridia bacterium]|nr:leucine-rich repeat domain-containing protein [Clostridia bacterium]